MRPHRASLATARRPDAFGRETDCHGPLPHRAEVRTPTRIEYQSLPWTRGKALIAANCAMCQNQWATPAPPIREIEWYPSDVPFRNAPNGLDAFTGAARTLIDTMTRVSPQPGSSQRWCPHGPGAGASSSMSKAYWTLHRP